MNPKNFLKKSTNKAKVIANKMTIFSGNPKKIYNYAAEKTAFFKKIRSSKKKLLVHAEPVKKNEPANSYSNDILDIQPHPTSPLKAIRIAAILDEFSILCFQYEADFLFLSQKKWIQEIEQFRPHFLFVESAWEGNNKQWTKEIFSCSQNFKNLITFCKQNKIPTVFWNKEDPPNFNHFITSASLFDYIFTTDENCIPKYLEKISHTNVYPLPFAAQNKIHNPIASARLRKNIFFAGAFYQRHPERHKPLEYLLEPAISFGLDIYDRCSHLKQDPNYRFPEKFQHYCLDRIPYEQMLACYKKYKIGLNVNSVENSPTMFSRRVFEMLASGTTVISCYNHGIENIIGQGRVYFSGDHNTSFELYKNILSDEERRYKKAIKDSRYILENHTYTHRLLSILKKLGLESIIPIPEVTVIVFIHHTSNVSPIISQYKHQSYLNKKLCVIIDAKQKPIDNNVIGIDQKEITTHILDDSPNRFNVLLNSITSQYIAIFHEEDLYFPNYLQDQMLAFTYSNAKLVGKQRFYWKAGTTYYLNYENKENEYVNNFSERTLVAERKFLLSQQFACTFLNDNPQIENISLRYSRVSYATNRFNYLCRQDMPNIAGNYTPLEMQEKNLDV